MRRLFAALAALVLVTAGAGAAPRPPPPIQVPAGAVVGAAWQGPAPTVAVAFGRWRWRNGRWRTDGWVTAANAGTETTYLAALIVLPLPEGMGGAASGPAVVVSQAYATWEDPLTGEGFIIWALPVTFTVAGRAVDYQLGPIGATIDLGNLEPGEQRAVPVTLWK